MMGMANLYPVFYLFEDWKLNDDDVHPSARVVESNISSHDLGRSDPQSYFLAKRSTEAMRRT